MTTKRKFNDAFGKNAYDEHDADDHPPFNKFRRLIVLDCEVSENSEDDEYEKESNENVNDSDSDYSEDNTEEETFQKKHLPFQEIFIPYFCNIDSEKKGIFTEFDSLLKFIEKYDKHCEKTVLQVLKLNPTLNTTTTAAQIDVGGIQTRSQKQKKTQEIREKAKQRSLLDHLKAVKKLNDRAKIYRTAFQYTNKNNSIFDRLSEIFPHMVELNNLIGMKSLKDKILQQILYFVQDLHGNDLLHSVLLGAPGTGKTTVGRILGKIYRDIGILSKGHLIFGERVNFVGDVLGQTSTKTHKFLQKCIGNVLFIDEAYSFGSNDPNSDNVDSYAKEAIDALNKFLSEHSGDFICIIAGYEDSLRRSFFAHNEGLYRRFPWKFYMDTYDSKDLCDIFQYCVQKDGWEIDCSVLSDSKTKESFYNLFSKRYYYKNNGGDCYILLTQCKIAHSHRLIYLLPNQKASQFKKLSWSDLRNGYEKFCLLDKQETPVYNSMFI